MSYSCAAGQRPQQDFCNERVAGNSVNRNAVIVTAAETYNSFKRADNPKTKLNSAPSETRSLTRDSAVVGILV